MPGVPPRNAPPSERYRLERGPILLTGLQALARLPLDQVRRDRASGLRVGGYISGYPGSPLAGFDRVLASIEPLLAEHHIRFQLGLNEELAAAAVAGSQLVDLFPHTEFDGAIGMWFGKAPGLDRCLDVLRHANFTGISRFGGAVAVVGDDPSCKSSSLPSQSEHAFAHAMIPLLAPGSSREVLELGRHAYALSRYAGLWAGLKLVADVCDGAEIVDLPCAEGEVVLPRFEVLGRSFEKRLDPRLLPPMVLEIEKDLVFARLEAVRRYARANRLDRTLHRAERGRIGFIAAGLHARQLRSAFEYLGLPEQRCEQYGIRVLELGMLYPLDEVGLREFARGLDTLVVLDDRRDFLEAQVRSALYGGPDPPRVLGQRDPAGAPWLARDGALDPARLALDLGPFLAAQLGAADLRERADALRQQQRTLEPPLELSRRPHFCSGCPHLRSTRVPDGAAAAGGIGCHTMALIANREMRFFGAMGSEGAAWNGLAGFVDTPHLFQNLGDGTYFHSGRQAIRACVAAGTHITFKLLYNGAIAMTGGQSATGEKTLAPLLRDLLSDGVQKVVAVSNDPEVVRLCASNPALVRAERDESVAAMSALAEQPGVSVFVYDELCANEKQRRQKRGLLPAPSRRLLINEDVCEGCGECGQISECLSVRPVSTALGRKTRIHQGSCSQDESCALGNCPAFLSLRGDFALEPLALAGGLRTPTEEPETPEIGSDYSILMIGVGSTGVVTVNAILANAARLQGLRVSLLDQTGLAQRGGRVASHLRLSPQPIVASPVVPRGGADTLLAFDPLGAADGGGLLQLSPDRTRAVLHECIAPTANMVSDAGHDRVSFGALRERIAGRTRELHALPAEPLASAILGTHQSANVVLLGFAFERGAIPLASRSIEAAIREHGVACETNLAAFRLGRALAAHPQEIPALLQASRPPAIGEAGDPSRAQRVFSGLWEAVASLVSGQRDPDSGIPVQRLLAGWALDLRDYQNRAWAERYLRALLPVLRGELCQGGDTLSFSLVAARELYRLMAYKDEYEVARLLIRGPYRRWLDRRSSSAAGLRYWLHPPTLRRLGLSKKLQLGRGFEPALRALAGLRRLRGTVFDPFGPARREERSLIDWYEGVLKALCERLEELGVDPATEIAGMAATIRGYEALKLERAAEARERVEKALSVE